MWFSLSERIEIIVEEHVWALDLGKPDSDHILLSGGLVQAEEPLWTSLLSFCRNFSYGQSEWMVQSLVRNESMMVFCLCCFLRFPSTVLSRERIGRKLAGHSLKLLGLSMCWGNQLECHCLPRPANKAGTGTSNGVSYSFLFFLLVMLPLIGWGQAQEMQDMEGQLAFGKNLFLRCHYGQNAFISL